MTVYFVQENSEAKRIKIGFTDGDPLVRIRAIRTANAFPLTLLVAIPGTAKDEAALHVRFKDLRRHLEWFEPDARLLGFIEAMRMVYADQPVDDGRAEETVWNLGLYGLTRDQLNAIAGYVNGHNLLKELRSAARGYTRDPINDFSRINWGFNSYMPMGPYDHGIAAAGSMDDYTKASRDERDPEDLF